MSIPFLYSLSIGTLPVLVQEQIYIQIEIDNGVYLKLATSVKEGHHIKWWTASREAYSIRAELTSGLSVGMSLCLYVCL